MYKKICITNRHLAPEDFTQCLRQVIAQRPDRIILREKDLPEEEYRNLAETLLNLCRGTDVLPVLHSRTRVCRMLEHPYVHLTIEGLQHLTAEDRAWLKLAGASAHSVEEAREAEGLGADYITISPIFETQCKPGALPRGTAFLTAVKESVSIPVYALGGIHPDRIDDCLAAGADGVCMMSEYMQGGAR